MTIWEPKTNNVTCVLELVFASLVLVVISVTAVKEDILEMFLIVLPVVNVSITGIEYYKRARVSIERIKTFS